MSEMFSRTCFISRPHRFARGVSARFVEKSYWERLVTPSSFECETLNNHHADPNFRYRARQRNLALRSDERWSFSFGVSIAAMLKQRRNSDDIRFECGCETNCATEITLGDVITWALFIKLKRKTDQVNMKPFLKLLSFRSRLKKSESKKCVMKRALRNFHALV